MAAIIVASLLWLPSDCSGRTAAMDSGPVEAASEAMTVASAVSVASSETEAATTEAVTTTTTTTRKTSPAGQFSVNMILPFRKSTIRYSYTEPTGSAYTARTPAQVTDADQAHSMSVSPYGCGAVNNSVGAGGQRKRKRVRWKTTALPAAEDSVMTRAQTNTIVPLPGYPTAESGRGVVFEAAAEQLDQLYTVSRVAGTVSGTGDEAEASGKGGTTDAAVDGAVR